MWKTSALCLIAVLLVGAPRAGVAQRGDQPASRAAFAGMVTVPLRNGPQPLDLAGGGLAGTAFVARRENYNAHGYSILTLYVRATAFQGGRTLWHVVPFGRGTGGFLENVGTYEGADCILTDIRVVRPRRGGAVLVVMGKRDEGRSFADPAPVRFEVYQLHRNREGVAGLPVYYFELARTLRASRPYCDVNTAFERELGLGTHGLAGAESER